MNILLMLIENRLLINSIQVIKCIELYCKKNKLLSKHLLKIINIILIKITTIMIIKDNKEDISHHITMIEKKKTLI